MGKTRKGFKSRIKRREKKREKKKKRCMTVRKVMRGGFMEDGGLSFLQTIVLAMNEHYGTNQDLVPYLKEALGEKV